MTPGIPAAAAARLASAARFSRSLFTGAGFESPYVSRVTSSALEGSWAIPPLFHDAPATWLFRHISQCSCSDRSKRSTQSRGHGSTAMRLARACSFSSRFATQAGPLGPHGLSS